MRKLRKVTESKEPTPEEIVDIETRIKEAEVAKEKSELSKRSGEGKGKNVGMKVRHSEAIYRSMSDGKRRNGFSEFEYD